MTGRNLEKTRTRRLRSDGTYENTTVWKKPTPVVDKVTSNDLKDRVRKIYVQRGKLDEGLAVRRGAVFVNSPPVGDMWDRSKLKEEGIEAFQVAGITFKDVDSEAFAPGARLRFIPDPENEHDPNAVGIWGETSNGLLQAGWVPATRAAELQLKEESEGFVLSEWVSEKGKRQGIEVAWSKDPFALVVKKA